MSCLLVTDPSPYLCQLLYTEDLYRIAENKETPVAEKISIFDYLGDNGRNILILVNEPNETYLNPADLVFLTNILQAKQWSMKDIALLNLYQHPPVTLLQLKNFFSCAILLSFGVESNQLKINETPLNEVLNIDQTTIVSSHSLALIQSDKGKKMAFWNALKGV